MEVNGPGPVQSNFPIKPTGNPPPEVEKVTEPKPAAQRDEVEISSAGQKLDKLNQSSKMRQERLARIKADIEAGVYETPEKLDAALDKLLGEIGED